jgi:hypothetical protein
MKIRRDTQRTEVLIFKTLPSASSAPRGELSEPFVLFVTFVVRHLFTLVATSYFAMIALAKLRTFAATGRTA